MNNQSRTPAPSSVQATTSVRVSTPARPPPPLTPVRPSTQARNPTLIRTRIPVRASTPVGTHTPALVQTQTRVRSPALVQPQTPVHTPAPVHTPTPVHTVAPLVGTRFPAPALALASAPFPAPAWIPDPIPVLGPSPKPFPTSASPVGVPAEPAPEPSRSPERPASSPKPHPSVDSLAGLVHGPGLTAAALSSADPTSGLAPESDSSDIELEDFPALGHFVKSVLVPSSASTTDFASTSETSEMPARILIRVTYCYGFRYILLKRSLELQFPNLLQFEEEIAGQASGEFEVFVEGKLVHSKKKGDGFVDEPGLKKIVGIISKEIKMRGSSDGAAVDESSAPEVH